MTAAADVERAAWAQWADRLAVQALRLEVVRRDRYGGYYVDENGTAKKITCPADGPRAGAVNTDLWRKHFTAATAADVVGMHLLTPGDSMGKKCVIDIDNHTHDDAVAERNERYAIAAADRLTLAGFHPLLTTWGGGGFHISVYFRKAIPGGELKRFGEWCVRGWKEAGFDKMPEVFPRQDTVPADGYGNWCRCFGKHHTRDEWAKAWDGKEWVGAGFAIRQYLTVEGDDPGLIPDDAINPIPEAGNPGPPHNGDAAGIHVPSGPHAIAETNGHAKDAGDDVFDRFNRATPLDAVADWLTPLGHRVVRRTDTRVELCRAGKDGTGQSMNVELRDGIPVVYNFSDNANLPVGTGLNPSQLRAFLDYGGYGRAEMARLAAQIRAGGNDAAEIVPVHLTDVGNALQFAFDHAGDLCYVPAWGWCRYDGRRWRRDELGHAQELAKKTVRDMYARAATDRAALDEELAAGGDKDRIAPRMAGVEKRVKWALMSEESKRVHAVLTLGKTDPRLAAPADRFDTDPYALNVRNGTIDLTTGTLRPHRRDDYIAKLADVPFDPNAVCLTWDRFLAGVFPNDPELVGWVQRLVGYCLTGATKEHAVVVAWGTGGNGKTVFGETLIDLMGDYAHKANVELLLAGKHDRSATERAALAGKRFVVASEAGDGRRLNEPLVKECSGGDRITARFLYQDEFTFVPQFKVLLATNYRPEVRGVDEGVWRRLRLLPFVQRFWKSGEAEGLPHLKADPDLRSKLQAELPGILAWAVRGAVAWHRDGLGTCRTVADATTAYRESENLVGLFVDECCIRDPQEEVGATALFTRYVEWSDERKERALKQTRFGTGLSLMGFGRRKSHGRKVITGLRLAKPV
jgi:P4 family phage/plasmid primase-like protien